MGKFQQIKLGLSYQLKSLGLLTLLQTETYSNSKGLDQQLLRLMQALFQMRYLIRLL